MAFKSYIMLFVLKRNGPEGIYLEHFAFSRKVLTPMRQEFFWCSIPPSSSSVQRRTEAFRVPIGEATHVVERYRSHFKLE